jgi:uncharacterized glyoxalase superfamily protein PhnB
MSNSIPTKTCINPYVIVVDVDKTVDFYERAFGFKLSEKSPGQDGSICHAEMFFNDELVMFGKEGSCELTLHSPKSTGAVCPITLCLTVKDIDVFYKHALKEGAVSISAPEQAPWGARVCRLKDPDDYVWCVVTPTSPL